MLYSLVVTLVTVIPRSFMFRFLVCGETALLCRLVVTQVLFHLSNLLYQVKLDDLEIVWPDVIYNGIGEVMKKPLYIFIKDLFPDISFTDSKLDDKGLKQFLRFQLPPYTSTDPDIRTQQIITFNSVFPTHYYRFIIQLCGGCHTTVVGSYESATSKTITARLCLKALGDQTHFLSHKSSAAAVLTMKTCTSTPVVVDDVESKAAEHQMVLENYNGAIKSTLQRGQEKPLGGLIMTKNFIVGEVVLQKDDEGRNKVDIYNQKDQTEDVYETEVDHAEAMEEPVACRNFLAKMTQHFVKPKGGSCNFQDKHKEACEMLSGLKDNYNCRKIKTYAMPIAACLLIDEEVKKENDDDTTSLFVEVYKDKETFIKKVEESCTKTDELLEKHLVHKGEKKPHIENETDENIVNHEEVLNEVLEYVQGKTAIEITNLIKLFKKQKSNNCEVVGVAHTKLRKENPALGKKLKDLYLKEKKKDDPKVIQGVNQFTKHKADSYNGGNNKESKISVEFPIDKLSHELQTKVDKLLKQFVYDETEVRDIEKDYDYEYPASLDFPKCSQSTGRETFKSCKLYDFQSRNKEQLAIHLKNEHPECNLCKEKFKDIDTLNHHMKKHIMKTCPKCEAEVYEDKFNDHIQHHEKMKKFGEGLDKGKITKKKVNKGRAGKMTNWNAFVKENFEKVVKDIRRNIEHGTDKEVNSKATDILKNMWTNKTTVQKKVYTDKAKERNGQNVIDNEDVVKAIVQKRPATEELVKQKKSKEMRAEMGMECHLGMKYIDNNSSFKTHMNNDHGANSNLNNEEPQKNQTTLKQFPMCKKMMSGGDLLKNHMRKEHRKSLTHNDSDTADESFNKYVSLEENTVTLKDTTEDSTEEGSEEEDENVGVQVGDAIILKETKNFWPAKVMSKEVTQVEVRMFGSGEVRKVDWSRVKMFSLDAVR